jgi:hypothetical protein
MVESQILDTTSCDRVESSSAERILGSDGLLPYMRVNAYTSRSSGSLVVCEETVALRKKKKKE